MKWSEFYSCIVWRGNLILFGKDEQPTIFSHTEMPKEAFEQLCAYALAKLPQWPDMLSATPPATPPAEEPPEAMNQDSPATA